MKTNNIILIVVAGAGAFYIYNKMKKPSIETTRPTGKTRAPQPTDEIDKAAQKIKNVKKDVAKVKATIKKYVNPENVKKALNFIKKVKPINKKIK